MTSAQQLSWRSLRMRSAGCAAVLALPLLLAACGGSSGDDPLLRKTALKVVGVQRESQDYTAAFNAVTGAVMDRIIREVESDPHYRTALDASHKPAQGSVADAVCASMRLAASLLPVATIVTYTRSGYTSLRAARERPPVRVICMTPELSTARRLAVGWGMHCVHAPQPIEDVPTMVARACSLALDQGFAEEGDNVLVAAGMPFGTAGTTNFLHIAKA